MAVTTKQRLLLFFVTAVALIFCISGYFLAAKIGISKLWAGTWGALTFVTFVGVYWAGMRRTLRNADQEPSAKLPQPSAKVVSWMVGGFVVPIFASIFHLGTGFLIIPLLTLFQTAGVPAEILLGPISWLAMAFSVGGAIGVWFLIWNRYKHSLIHEAQ